MTTAPLGERINRGRGASSIRTPLLIRDYLSGQGVFPEDTPEERAARPAQGDYLARMHRRIKLYIRAAEPTYQYPRHHSFVALVNNLLVLRLLEETGLREDPTQRGAGALGTDGGFKQRVYVRLTEGSITRREWADPIGFVSLIYPNIRPAERPLPTAPPAPVVTPPAEVPAAPLAPTELQALEQRRLSIVAEARALATTGNTVAQFQRLLRRAALFLNDVTRALPPRPFPAAPEALDLLENCIRLLEMERDISPRRVTAITNCQASSRLLGEALSAPVTSAALAPPGLVPVAELPDFELPGSPTRRNAEILARHLRLLQRLGVQRGDVQGRMAEIAEDLEGWVDQLNDAITQEQAGARPRQARLDVLRRILGEIEEVGSSLGVGEIAEAIEALARAYPPTG